MHHVRKAAEIELTVPDLPVGATSGHARADLVGKHTGALHTGFALCELLAAGHVAPHLHSYEESFYVLRGSPVLTLAGRHHQLAPDECGLIPVGTSHAWRLTGTETALWLEMAAPAPRIGGPKDTFFTGEPLPDAPGAPLDIRDPRSQGFFRLDPGLLELDSLKLGAPVDAPTVSASMATALLAYSGIAVRMLVDQRLGAVLHTMFMVEYEPGGVAQPHDHPLEETYYILSGEVEAVADGETLILEPGDVFWTGVGTVHAFYNRSPDTRVRWLETQAPQPPSHHSYRFNRDWNYLEAQIALENQIALETQLGSTGLPDAT